MPIIAVMPEPTVYVGRQPIFDRRRTTFAYQLLHRGSRDNVARVGTGIDGDAATATMIDRLVFQWGLDGLLGGKPGFVHVTADVLRRGLHRALPADRVVLEVLDDVDRDADGFVLVADAKRLGYRIAVDDAVSSERRVSADLLGLADVAKVDVTAVDTADLEPTVQRLRSASPRAILMAEKVEDRRDFRMCLAHGFDLFAGYFFAKPEVLSRGGRIVSSTGALALLAEVHQPGISLSRLQHLVTADPTLAFRLLALVNSGMSGLACRVESVAHALVLLGTERVRQLATVLTLAMHSDASEELLTLACVRANMAKALVGDPRLEGGAHTVGLLSVLDVIFRAPMAELVDALPLAPAAADALRDEAGPLGILLGAVRAYERGDLVTLERLRPGQLPAFVDAYTAATAWAEGVRPQFTSAA